MTRVTCDVWVGVGVSLCLWCGETKGERDKRHKERQRETKREGKGEGETEDRKREERPACSFSTQRFLTVKNWLLALRTMVFDVVKLESMLTDALTKCLGSR